MRVRIAVALLCGILLTGCAADAAEEHSMIAELTEAAEPVSAAPVTTVTEPAADAETTASQTRISHTTAVSETGAAAVTVSDSGKAPKQHAETRTEPRRQTVQQQGGNPSVPAVTKPPRTASAEVSGSTGSTVTVNTTEPTTAISTEAAETDPPQPPDLYGRLAAMSLHEKAEQMTMSSAADEATAVAAIQRGTGGMCLFAGAFRGKSAAQVQQMTARMQAAAKTPVLICVDEEGGPVNRVSLNPMLRAAPFRNSRVIYDEGGWDALRSDAAEKADLLLSLGVNVNLGPVCDVPVDPSNYIYARTFGLEPLETADYAGVVVSEARAHGLGTVLKHFPGYGGSIDTHQFMAYDTREYSAFSERDFLPFSAGIAAGADSVMVSHNIVSCMDGEHPASLSPEVHRILREDLGFTGVIMTDDLGMGAISLYTGGQNAAVAAVLAGNDIVMFADDAGSAEAIVSAVGSGLISEEQINDSVLRILLWKQSLGLIE